MIALFTYGLVILPWIRASVCSTEDQSVTLQLSLSWISVLSVHPNLLLAILQYRKLVLDIPIRAEFTC